MSRISTHILDTSKGRPASGVRVQLFADGLEMAAAETDADGRCANLLPSGTVLRAGVYRLVFATGSYFPDGFYPEVSVAFHVTEHSDHYHVPLLISGFGYSTYRGS